MRRRRTVAALGCLVVLAMGAGACSGDDDDERLPSPTTTDDGPDTTNGEAEGPALDWEDCGSLECATLVVPLDHGKPLGRTIELALSRRPADGDAIGSLLFNPGGPGVAAIPYLADADFLFSSELLENFDIVAWDPRGTGDSSPVDCIDDLDEFYALDRSPDDLREVESIIHVTDTFVFGCVENSEDLLPHLGSMDTVADMDAIRTALGEEQLTYIGFSYGTYLGALYAEAYPDRVRALVLDGAIDPSLSPEVVNHDQAIGFESALNAFVADCEDDDDCAFGGSDVRAAYDALLAQIDAESLPANIDDEERLLGPGEADLGVATALYAGEDGWPILADALNEAAQGDGTQLLELSDAYTDRTRGGFYSNQGEAFYAIGCLDAPSPSYEELEDLAEEAAVDAPAFGAATFWLSSPCAEWPEEPTGTPHEITASGAPPIVVIGTTGDPATPLRWAEGLASQLESGVLLVFEGEGHTAYARGSSCIDDAVDRYLIDLEVPDDETRCD